MRTAKPGKWWVLRQNGVPHYWTGKLVPHTIDGQQLQLAHYSTLKEDAQQFGDRAAAVFIASIFGLSQLVEPVELEFAS